MVHLLQLTLLLPQACYDHFLALAYRHSAELVLLDSADRKITVADFSADTHWAAARHCADCGLEPKPLALEGMKELPGLLIFAGGKVMAHKCEFGGELVVAKGAKLKLTECKVSGSVCKREGRTRGIFVAGELTAKKTVVEDCKVGMELVVVVVLMIMLPLLLTPLSRSGSSCPEPAPELRIIWRRAAGGTGRRRR